VNFEGAVMSNAHCRSAPNISLVSTARRASPALSALAGARTLLHWIIRLWQREAAIRELGRLSDRELRDLGIVRGQLEDLVAALDRMPPTRVRGQRGRPDSHP
jgi:uncharacterized protein YjiS (DUF1127 family)